MKNTLLIIIICVLSGISCLGILDKMSGITIEKIQKKKKIVAVTSYSINSYFIYKGEPLGFEYELLKKLSESMDVALEIKLNDNDTPIIDILNQGNGDIVASNLAITKKRMQEYDFTDHFITVKQVLVQRIDGNAVIIRNPIDLIGKKVVVCNKSHYTDRLKNLSDEIGGDIKIKTMTNDYSEEDLIRMVSEGKISYTIADETVAMVNRFYYPNIDIETPVSFPQRIAWVVRRESPELLKYINKWILENKQNGSINQLYEKYYRINRVLEEQIAFSLKPDSITSISDYDDLVRSYAQQINFDWRLISAIIYQESRFNPNAKSWAGAGGLMQLMPATAKMMGVSNRYDPEESLKGGTKFLSELMVYWKPIITDDENLIKFVLASYNAGTGHVKDAQNLAEKYGANKFIWDKNVDSYILKLSNPEYYNDPVVNYGYCRGEETFLYVKKITERYEMYKINIPFEKPEKDKKSNKK